MLFHPTTCECVLGFDSIPGEKRKIPRKVAAATCEAHVGIARPALDAVVMEENARFARLSNAVKSGGGRLASWSFDAERVLHASVRSATPELMATLAGMDRVAADEV